MHNSAVANKHEGHIMQIWGYHSGNYDEYRFGNYDEYRFLVYKNAVRISQETLLLGYRPQPVNDM
jgi:hypothetical protein